MFRERVKRYRLVYAITVHPYLGNMIEAFKVMLNDDDSFSMTYTRLNPQNINEYEVEMDEFHKELIQWIDKYSENAIVEKFSRKSRYFNDFVDEEWSESLFKTKIYPYIQKYMARILSMMWEKDIPLYYKGEKNNFFHEEPIQYVKEPVRVIYYFQRTKEEIRYFLTLKSKKEKLPLNKYKTLILTEKPPFVLTGNKLLLFEESFLPKRLIPFLSKDYVSIPGEMEEKYLQTFIKPLLEEQCDVICEGFKVSEETSEPVPVLTLDYDLHARPVLMLYFKYNDKKIKSFNQEKAHVEINKIQGNYQIKITRRNQEKEAEIIKFLELSGLKLENVYWKPAEFESWQMDDLLDWLMKHKKELEKAGVLLDIKDKSRTYYLGDTTVELQFSREKDWFDLKAWVVFGDYKVPLIKLRKNLLYGIREYPLPGNKVAILPEEWFTTLKDLVIFSSVSGDGLKIKRNDTRSMPVNMTKSHMHPHQLKQLIADFKNQQKPGIPQQLKARLRTYQQKGFEWLYYMSKQGVGVILADDMGLGKTVQTLTLLLKFKEENSDSKEQIQVDLFRSASPDEKNKPALIVAPTSLIFNWVQEINKFTPSLIYYVHAGQNRSLQKVKIWLYDVIITSYGTLRNDIDLLAPVEFSVVVLDESQNIKNPRSKISRAVMKLKAQSRVALTGTPVENSLSDLWSQLNFLNPGLLGSFSSFKENFIEPIEKHNQEERKLQLKRKIQPFILRRTKNEVALELPPLSENIRYCEMTSEQKKWYEKIKSAVRRELLAGDTLRNPSAHMITILKGIMKLRQMANHPVLAGINAKMEESGKYTEVSESMINLLSENHKLLVFSSFETHLNIYEKFLNQKNIKYSFLSGKVRGSERESVIKDFQTREDIHVLLATLKTGGVGLNLTASDYVFLLDPWWNPAAEMQAISRAHRMGQNRKVFAYKFITAGSIEEKILSLQQKKKNLAREFESSHNPLWGMTAEEINELFE